MIIRILRLTLISLITVGIMLAINGCGKSETEKTKSQAASGQKQEARQHEHAMSGKALSSVYTADTLYTCPMHPEVVTAAADAKCPICNMNLKKMSDEAVSKLRGSHPKGCAMCNIVVSGASEMTQCPKCNMKLVEVPMEKGHEH